MIIGLRVYKVQVYKSHVALDLDGKDVASHLLSAFKRYINLFSTSALNDGDSKIVRFEPEADFANSLHGWLNYGSYGYGSKVENVNTGSVDLNRSPQQADTIPLYYRFWLPPKRKYGLMALQSFGGKSCSDIVRRAIAQAHSQSFPEYRITTKKLMPNDLKLYAERPVRQIHLVRKNSDQSIVDRVFRPVSKEHTLDLEFSLKARSGGDFGKLKEIEPKIGGHLEIGGIDFEGAFAEVKVGSSYKRIGVVGVSSTAGVIDISDEIVRNADKHPTLNSIQKATQSNLKEFIKVLG